MTFLTGSVTAQDSPQQSPDSLPVAWHVRFDQEPTIRPRLQQRQLVSLNVEPTTDRGCIVSATSFLPSGFLPYIVKLSAAGTVNWHRALPPGTVVCQVKQHADGGYVAVGDMFKYNSRSIFITQFDKNGQPVSHHQIPFMAGADLNCHRLLSSPDGGFMLIGLKSPGVGQAGKPVRSVLFLAKLTKYGQPVWTKTPSVGSVTVLQGGYAHKTGYVLSVLSDIPNPAQPASGALSRQRLHISETGECTWPSDTTGLAQPQAIPFVDASYQPSAGKNLPEQAGQPTGPAHTTRVVSTDADGNTFLAGTTRVTNPQTGSVSTTVWVRKRAAAPLQPAIPAPDSTDTAWWARLSANPVTESATVDIHGTAGAIIYLHISQTNGREISRQQVMGTGRIQHCTLRLGEQPAALYLICVRQEQHVQWLKVIKE